MPARRQAPDVARNCAFRDLEAELRVRLGSLEDAQLLTEGKDLEAEVVARTEECAEAGDEADKKWNHEFGFIA